MISKKPLAKLAKPQKPLATLKEPQGEAALAETVAQSLSRTTDTKAGSGRLTN